MQNRRRTSNRTVVLVAVLVYALLGTLVATAVATNAFEAGNHLNGLMQRVRLALDPPPDREVLPIIEVTETGKEVATGSDGSALQLPRGQTAEKTPRPRRAPVDVRLRLKPARAFASQVTTEWCAVAGTQMVLAMHDVSRQLGGVPAPPRRTPRRVGEPQRQPQRRLGTLGHRPGARRTRPGGL